MVRHSSNHSHSKVSLETHNRMLGHPLQVFSETPLRNNKQIRAVYSVQIQHNQILLLLWAWAWAWGQEMPNKTSKLNNLLFSQNQELNNHFASLKTQAHSFLLKTLPPSLVLQETHSCRMYNRTPLEISSCLVSLKLLLK